MDRRVVAAGIALFGTALTACVSNRDPIVGPATAVVWEAASQPTCADVQSPAVVETLLDYARQLRSVPSETLEWERADSERSVAQQPTAENQIRLALLLSLAKAPFRDDARARDLLVAAATADEHEGAAVQGLAIVLLQQLEERRGLESALDATRRERQGLQRKLDQLKAIEEQIDPRLPPNVSPPPP